MNLEILLAIRDIQAAHSRYARALDERNWALLDTIFAPDVQADYGSGEFRTDGRAALVAMIRSHLDGCGPTQHLLGTPDVEVQGNQASSCIYVRASHRGLGAKSDLTYEALGEYRAQWRRTQVGWRAARWDLRVSLELGTREVLGLR